MRTLDDGHIPTGCVTDGFYTSIGLVAILGAFFLVLQFKSLSVRVWSILYRKQKRNDSGGVMKSSLMLLLIVTTQIGAPAAKGTRLADSHNRISELKVAMQDVDRGPILVVAHRGCWLSAPENSLESLEACLRVGVDAVEIDVRLSRDGVPLVFHDGSLHRMTQAWGYFHEWDAAELKQLHLYERDGSTTHLVGKKLLTDQTIPSLREVFAAVKGRMLVNVEIKSDAVHSFKEVLSVAVELASAMGVEDHVFWKLPASNNRTDDDDTRADEVYATAELIDMPFVFPIIWQSGRPFQKQLEDFNQHNVIGFEIVAQDLAYWPLSKGRLLGAEKYRYMGVAVLPQWSAGLSDQVSVKDPESGWGNLIRLGFDVIMTDRPERLIRYLERKGLRD